MGVINKTAASFGVTPLAIIGVLVRIWRFALMPLLGLGQGMLPLIGYNFGAGRKKRVSELVFNASLLGSAWTVFCWLILMLFPAGIMSIFSDDNHFRLKACFVFIAACPVSSVIARFEWIVDFLPTCGFLSLLSDLSG